VADVDPKSVDAYIAAAAEAARPVLARIREVLREALPASAREVLSYRMPAFEDDGIILYYAAFKKHIGIFPPIPVPAGSVLDQELAPLRGPKGNLQIPLAEPFPYELVARVAAAALLAHEQRRAERLARAAAKRADRPKATSARRAR